MPFSLKNIKLPFALYCVPFFFFWKTRLTRLHDWIFHGWNEWLIIWLLLWYITNNLQQAVFQFAVGYIVFISLYEVGYIINDLVAVKKETNPRLRFGDKPVPGSWIGLWLFCRVLLFSLFAFYLQPPPWWWAFYVCLIIVFSLHNWLQSRALKTYTFIQLALFRFWAPGILFLPRSFALKLFPIVMLYYAFSRTLTYMDSKSLLALPERSSITYRLQCALLLLLFSVFWYLYTNDLIVLLLAAYFSVFWLIASAFKTKKA